MSDTNSSAPSLSQYFGPVGTDSADFCRELNDASSKINDLKLEEKPSVANKNEPEVCRIFAETPPQPRDQTTSFFDVIGNNHNVTSSGLISDLDLPQNNDVTNRLEVVTTF